MPPRTIIGTEPYLSETAPNTGCAAPQTNCPTATAKLIEAMPRPVDVLIGDTKRPVVCRAPIVIIRIAAAESISTDAAAGDEASRGLFTCAIPYFRSHRGGAAPEDCR